MLTPWANAWIPYYTRVFAERDHQVQSEFFSDPDVVLHMWTDGFCSMDKYPEAVNMLFLRSYELFETRWMTFYDWSKVDAFIFCNPRFMEMAMEAFRDAGIPNPPMHLSYNGTDLSEWKFRDRGPVHGNKIGMACHVHVKKNIPIAMEILQHLPPGYELHIAGMIQHFDLYRHICYRANQTKRKVFFYGEIPHGHMDAWWEDKDFCLSTSIREGNPNNILEIMAKGIKPVIMDWEGSKDEFPGYVCGSVPEAIDMIVNQPIKSREYRQFVKDRYSLDNYRRVVLMAEDLFEKKRNKTSK